MIGGKKGYDQARQILKKRYGNKHLISQRIIADLRSGKHARTGNEIQQLADELSVALTTLKEMNFMSEINMQQSILDIHLRFPSWVRAKWRKKALDCIRNTDLYPTFDDFVNFVQNVSIDACDPLYGSSSSSTRPSAQLGACNSVTIGGTSTGAAAHSAPVQVASRDGRQAPQKRSCVVCHQAHRVFQCERFKAMSPTDRLAVARSNGLCFNCLFPGHRIQQCKKPSFCTVTGCTRKHRKFLHQQTETRSNGSEPDPAPATDTAPAVGMVSHGSPSSTGTSVCAYLPIVQVLING